MNGAKKRTPVNAIHTIAELGFVVCVVVGEVDSDARYEADTTGVIERSIGKALEAEGACIPLNLQIGFYKMYYRRQLCFG